MEAAFLSQITLISVQFYKLITVLLYTWPHYSITFTQEVKAGSGLMIYWEFAEYVHDLTQDSTVSDNMNENFAYESVCKLITVMFKDSIEWISHCEIAPKKWLLLWV